MLNTVLLLVISIQLAELSPCSPTNDEIWRYFSTDMVQAVGRWQMERKETPNLMSMNVHYDGKQYINHLLQEIASYVQKMLSECNNHDEKTVILAKVTIIRLTMQ